MGFLTDGEDGLREEITNLRAALAEKEKECAYLKVLLEVLYTYAKAADFSPALPIMKEIKQSLSVKP